jgi:hypothetical protein
MHMSAAPHTPPPPPPHTHTHPYTQHTHRAPGADDGGCAPRVGQPGPREQAGGDPAGGAWPPAHRRCRQLQRRVPRPVCQPGARGCCAALRLSRRAGAPGRRASAARTRARHMPSHGHHTLARTLPDAPLNHPTAPCTPPHPPPPCAAADAAAGPRDQDGRRAGRARGDELCAQARAAAGGRDGRQPARRGDARLL